MKKIQILLFNRLSLFSLNVTFWWRGRYRGMARPVTCYTCTKIFILAALISATQTCLDHNLWKWNSNVKVRLYCFKTPFQWSIFLHARIGEIVSSKLWKVIVLWKVLRIWFCGADLVSVLRYKRSATKYFFTLKQHDPVGLPQIGHSVKT